MSASTASTLCPEDARRQASSAASIVVPTPPLAPCSATIVPPGDSDGSGEWDRVVRDSGDGTGTSRSKRGVANGDQYKQQQFSRAGRSSQHRCGAARTPLLFK